MQVYAGLPILTGAASAEERAELEHRLLGFVPIDRTFSAGAYAQRAHAGDRRPHRSKAGGRSSSAAPASTCAPRSPTWTSDRRSTRPSGSGSPTRPIEQLHAELPEAVAAGIAPTDRQRVLRAHELLEAGHAPPPPAHAPSQLWTAHTRHPTLLAALVMERQALAARIDQRVDEMLANGAEAEVRAADRAGASATARRALGFQELLDGDVAAMKTRTRRYAKRQLTWLRKLPGAQLVDVTGRTPEDVAAELAGMI